MKTLATHTAEFRWTTSRGRDTYGYNICSLYVDGIKVASCSGGGYDMQGTCLAEYIQDAYQERLWKIRKRANTHAEKIGKEYTRLPDNDGKNRLYGMTAIYTNTKHTEGKVSLDGGCGMSSVEAICKAINIEVKWVAKVGRDGSIYRIEVVS